MSRRRFLAGLLIVAVLFTTLMYPISEIKAFAGIVIGQLAKKGAEKALSTSMVRAAGVKGNKKAIERAQEAWFSRLDANDVNHIRTAAQNASPYENWPGWLKTTVSVATFVTGADLIFTIYDIMKDDGYIEYNTEYLDEDEEFIETFGVYGVIGWRLEQHGPDSFSCSSPTGTIRYPYYLVVYKYLNADGTISEKSEVFCRWTSMWFSGYEEEGVTGNSIRYRVEFAGYNIDGQPVKWRLNSYQYRPIGVPIEYGFPVYVNEPIPDIEWEPYYPIEIPQYDYFEIYFPDPSVYPDPATAPRPVILPPGVAPGVEPGTYPDGIQFPDPVTQPVPTPVPEPNPNPDPEPIDDPWRPGGDEVTEIDFSPLREIPNVMTERFPFSLPWDIKKTFEAMSTTPELMDFKVAIYDPKTKTVRQQILQLPDWVSIFAQWTRWAFLISFTIALIILTRRLLGGSV